jgi:hypothetical protein
LKGKAVARFYITARKGETAGNGECKLKSDGCVSVDMQIGDQQLFRVNGVEYQLELVSINGVASGSGATDDPRTRVRFGDDGAATHSIDRLKVLGGSGSDPVLLYLGVLEDGKRGLFVLGAHTHLTKNEGDCMDGDACRIIGLRRGDSAVVVSGASRTYALDVTSVTSRESADVADNGRDALRGLIAHHATAVALQDFRWAPDRGVIERLPGS